MNIKQLEILVAERKVCTDLLDDAEGTLTGIKFNENKENLRVQFKYAFIKKGAEDQLTLINAKLEEIGIKI